MIKLNGEFTPIPEGTYIFKITKVENKPDFGKLNVTMKTQAGKVHVELFNLFDKSGLPNPVAEFKVALFVKTVMNDFTLDGDFNEQEMVGHYVKADVEHNTSASGKTYAHVKNFEVASSFEGEEPTTADEGFENIAEATEEDDLLNSLLNQ
jgi:hypothetical protein